MHDRTNIQPGEITFWDESVLKMPLMNCGNIGTAHYTEHGVMAKYVNIEGSVSNQITGAYCIEIAYAAQRYQDMLIETEKQKKELGHKAQEYTENAIQEDMFPYVLLGTFVGLILGMVAYVLVMI